jgi:tetratricopeptide (TPR) repeat protein
MIRRLLCAFAAACIVLLCHRGGLSGPFVLDDVAAVTENPSVAQTKSWSEALWSPGPSPTAGRPLLNLSFALNWRSYGDQPAGYHRWNLGIHLVNATLLALLLHALFRQLDPKLWRGLDPALAAILASTLWALHPVQTICVAYVSQRAESLMALFYLLTLVLFVRGATASHPARWHAAATLACAAGMATKEVMATAPLSCLLLDAAFFSGSLRQALTLRWRSHAANFATLTVLVWLSVSTSLGQRLALSNQGPFSTDYGMTSLRAWGEYLRVTLWPHPLIFDRGFTPAALAPYPVWAGLLALAGLSTLIALGLRSAPRAATAGGLFVLILLPTTSLIPVWGQPIGENRLYLPLAAAAGLAIPLGLQAGHRAGLCLLTLLVMLAGLATAIRSRTYSSALSLWTDTVAKAPDNFRAHGALGLALLSEPARRDEALASLNRAAQLKPDDAETRYQLGRALADDPARAAEAETQLLQCISLQPTHALGHAQLGLLRFALRRPTEAEPHLRRACTLRPDRNDFRILLGVTLSSLSGGAREAVDLLEAAVTQEPLNAAAWMNLGNAYHSADGNDSRALTAYQRAVAVRPEYADAWHNLGLALASQPGKEREAEAARQRAAALRAPVGR